MTARWYGALAAALAATALAACGQPTQVAAHPLAAAPSPSASPPARTVVETIPSDAAVRAVVRKAAAPPPTAPPIGRLEAALRPVAHSAKAAAREADAALLLVHLPEAVEDSGVTAVAPDDVFSIGSGPPSVVERQTRWTAAMAPNDLSDYEQAHPPVGFTASEFSSGGGEVTQGFTTAANPYLTVRVIMTQQGNASAVRINVQVIWTPPRTAVETIATGVTSAWLRYVGPQRPNGKPGPVTRLTLHGSQLSKVVRTINALQTEPLNLAGRCQAEFGQPATLRIHSRGHLLVFSLTGCLNVGVTSDGVAQPALTDTDALNALLRAVVR
jgi:hypothetical protein